MNLEGEKQLLEQIGNLCMSDDYSDVVFVVENERVPAHRNILAMRSQYFRGIFYGDLTVGKSDVHEIAVKEPLKTFKTVLRYIYTGKMTVSETEIFDTLTIAHKYGISIERLVMPDKQMKKNITLESVCALLNLSLVHDLKNLTRVSLEFMDDNAANMLQHASFKSLSKASLEEILRRDTFAVPELKIFVAVMDWSKSNPNADVKSLVRLPLIDQVDLLEVVRPSCIFDSDEIFEAIKQQTTKCLPPRRVSALSEKKLLTYEFQPYTTGDMERANAVYNINPRIVELTTTSVINNIKLLLADSPDHYFSYSIEVTVDKARWDCVAENEDYYCAGDQDVYFKPRPVRYIKLTALHRDYNKKCLITGLEALHITPIPVRENLCNIDPVEISIICEIAINFRTRWENSRQSLLIAFGQPIMLDSACVSLCDLASNIQLATSINLMNWQLADCSSAKKDSSSLTYKFGRAPFVFMRITLPGGGSSSKGSKLCLNAYANMCLT